MKKLLVLSALVLGLVSCEKDEVPTSDCGCDKIIFTSINYKIPNSGFYKVSNDCNPQVTRDIPYTNTPTPQKEGECYKAN